MPHPTRIVKSLFYEQKNGMSDDMTKSFEVKKKHFVALAKEEYTEG